MAQFHLIRGKNYFLTPLPLVDKALGRIASTARDEQLEKYKKIALNWIRRTVWSEIAVTNLDKDYEDIKVPLTQKEFNWLKSEYDKPI